MKHTIGIPGLPEGWEPVAYDYAVKNDYVLIGDEVVIATHTHRTKSLIVKKKQPRRIVLEEIPDDLVSESYSGTCVRIGNKWWREVNESDLSLHNADDNESLRLNIDYARELLNYIPGGTEFHKKIVDFIRVKK